MRINHSTSYKCLKKTNSSCLKNSDRLTESVVYFYMGVPENKVGKEISHQGLCHHHGLQPILAAFSQRLLGGGGEGTDCSWIIG
jgi:hypothetical protein